MNKTQKMTSKQSISEKDAVSYVLERFADVKRSNEIKNLVSFQTMNKFMIMAHDQNELKILGNLVASYKKNKLSEIMSEYEKHLKLSLKKTPTIKSHSNVILHIYGHFSADLNQFEKEQFHKLLEQFKDEEITIGKILSKINLIVFRFNNTYLASQTYFLLYADTLLDIF